MQRKLIVTNNPEVRGRFADFDILFVEGGYRDVLVKCRDMIHAGASLLTHPMMGSIKPNETPYRTVALKAAQAGASLDAESLELIESAILSFDKFASSLRFDRGSGAPESVLADFRSIDLSLISSALDR